MRRGCKKLREICNRLSNMRVPKYIVQLDWDVKRRIAVGSCLAVMGVACLGSWQKQKTLGVEVVGSSSANQVVREGTRAEKQLQESQATKVDATEATTQVIGKTGHPNENAKAVVLGPDGVIYSSDKTKKAQESTQEETEKQVEQADELEKGLKAENEETVNPDGKELKTSENKNRVVPNGVTEDGKNETERSKNSNANQVVSNPELTQHISNTYGDYGATREKQEEAGKYQYPVEIGYEQDSNYNGVQSEQDIILKDSFTLATTEESEDKVATTELTQESASGTTAVSKSDEEESQGKQARGAEATTQASPKGATVATGAKVATQASAKSEAVATGAEATTKTSPKETTREALAEATTQAGKAEATTQTKGKDETTAAGAEATTQAVGKDTTTAARAEATTQTKGKDETTATRAESTTQAVGKDTTTAASVEATIQASSKSEMPTTELPQEVMDFLYQDVRKMLLPTQPAEEVQGNRYSSEVRRWKVNSSEQAESTMQSNSNETGETDTKSDSTASETETTTELVGATTAELDGDITTESAGATTAESAGHTIAESVGDTTTDSVGEATTKGTVTDISKQDRTAPTLGLSQVEGNVLESGETSIICTNQNRIPILTNDDFDGVQGSGIQKIGYVYANHLKYIVDSFADAKLHLPENYYGRVLVNATDQEENVSRLLSQYVLVEQTPPSISWSDGDTCSAPYTLWVDLEEEGDIVSGIRDVECYVNGAAYEITDLDMVEKTYLSNDLQVATKRNFSILLPEEGQYTVTVKVTDNAGNVKEQTRVISVAKADLVSVYMPEHFTIHMDPWKQYSEKQIYSDEVVLENASSCDVKVTIDNINLKVNAKDADAGTIKDCEVYLVTPDTGERIRLQPGNNKKVYSYRLPKEVDVTKSYLYFEGAFSKGSEAMWQNADISIKMQLSFSKWEE